MRKLWMLCRFCDLILSFLAFFVGNRQESLRSYLAPSRAAVRWYYNRYVDGLGLRGWFGGFD